jgi:hypothetical protein
MVVVGQVAGMRAFELAGMALQQPGAEGRTRRWRLDWPDLGGRHRPCLPQRVIAAAVGHRVYAIAPTDGLADSGPPEPAPLQATATRAAMAASSLARSVHPPVPESRRT